MKSNERPDKRLHIRKKVAGGATGAVVGAAVAGPVGALVGGVVGTLVGSAGRKAKIDASVGGQKCASNPGEREIEDEAGREENQHAEQTPELLPRALRCPKRRRKFLGVDTL